MTVPQHHPLGSKSEVDFGEATAPKSDLMREIGSYTGTGLEGRGTAASRKALAGKYGGTPGSEEAVAAAVIDEYDTLFNQIDFEVRGNASAYQ